MHCHACDCHRSKRAANRLRSTPKASKFQRSALVLERGSFSPSNVKAQRPLCGPLGEGLGCRFDMLGLEPMPRRHCEEKNYGQSLQNKLHDNVSLQDCWRCEEYVACDEY